MPETNNPRMPVETNGLQIKVWIPQDFYDLLRARSARFHTSVAEEARKLMQAGVVNIKPSETLETMVTDLDRYVRLHLEPLAFVAAMDAGYSAEGWRKQWEIMRTHNIPTDFQALDQELREKVTKRIQRKLRELPDEGDPEDKEDE